MFFKFFPASCEETIQFLWQTKSDTILSPTPGTYAYVPYVPSRTSVSLRINDSVGFVRMGVCFIFWRTRPLSGISSVLPSASLMSVCLYLCLSVCLCVGLLSSAYRDAFLSHPLHLPYIFSQRHFGGWESHLSPLRSSYLTRSPGKRSFSHSQNHRRRFWSQEKGGVASSLGMTSLMFLWLFDCLFALSEYKC